MATAEEILDRVEGAGFSALLGRIIALADEYNAIGDNDKNSKSAGNELTHHTGNRVNEIRYSARNLEDHIMPLEDVRKTWAEAAALLETAIRNMEKELPTFKSGSEEESARNDLNALSDYVKRVRVEVFNLRTIAPAHYQTPT